MIRRRFRARAPGGEMVAGDVRVPQGPPRRSAVVVIHGFKGFKDWGFFPHVCRELAGAGFSVVSFNFSLGGVGSDSEEFTDLEAFARNTFTRELEDLAWVVDQVSEGDLLPRKPERIGLLGHSRGGADAILTAREDSRIRALVTWAAVAELDRWSEETKREWRSEGRVYVLNSRTGQQMPLDVTLLEDLEENRDRLDVEGAAAEVEVPWLIVHGTEDRSVSVKEAKRLARAASGARLRLVEGAGHTFECGHPFEGPSPELRQAMEATRAHFRTHLGRD